MMVKLGYNDLNISSFIIFNKDPEIIHKKKMVGNDSFWIDCENLVTGNMNMILCSTSVNLEFVDVTKEVNIMFGREIKEKLKLTRKHLLNRNYSDDVKYHVTTLKIKEKIIVYDIVEYN